MAPIIRTVIIFLPDLSLPETTPVGIWGQRRKHYLKTQRGSLYNALLLSGKLNDHLVEVVFEQLMYNINLNTPENGAIEYEGDLYLPYGSNKQLSFIPEEGYRIKDIKINNVSIGTPSTYTFLNIQEDQMWL